MCAGESAIGWKWRRPYALLQLASIGFVLQNLIQMGTRPYSPAVRFALVVCAGAIAGVLGFYDLQQRFPQLSFEVHLGISVVTFLVVAALAYGIALRKSQR
jgi:hypothetical protein